MITIFTPIYNRAHLLQRCYNSLLQQKNFDFEWLIVDDGSSDNTEAIVQTWVETEVKFPIRYIKKNNGGKHTAVNVGAQNANGKYFLILDSDDQLLPNTIEVFTDHLHLIEGKDFGGILGLNQNVEEELTGTVFPKDKMYSDFACLYYKLGVKGDKSVLWKTECLLEFPFPEPEGIKFISESVVWHPLSEKYPVLCLNEHVAVIEYQSEGLSDSSYKKSFIEGIAFTNYFLLKNNIHSWAKYPKIKWQEYVQLIINSKLSQISYFRKLSLLDKIAYLIAYPRSYYSYLNMKKYVEKNKK